jgi:hypothetical protein
MGRATRERLPWVVYQVSLITRAERQESFITRVISPPLAHGRKAPDLLQPSPELLPPGASPSVFEHLLLLIFFF